MIAATEIPTGWAALRQLPLVDRVPLLGLPSLWVGLCVYFCIRSLFWGMPRTERIDKVARSPYLPRVIMEFGYWMFTGPIALCMRLGVTPNMLTVGALLVSVTAAIGFGMGHFSLGGWLLFLAFMMDAWDGMVARRRGTSSVAGEFLDASIVIEVQRRAVLFGAALLLPGRSRAVAVVRRRAGRLDSGELHAGQG